jgi:hypothetical protein
MTPILFDFSLSRADEMILGVAFPAFCLLIFELYYKTKRQVSEKYLDYMRKHEVLPDSEPQANEKSTNNNFGIKVLGTAVIVTGVMISALGIISTSGKIIVISIGIILMLLGFFIKSKSRK